MQRNKPAFILGSQKAFHPGMNVCACDRESYMLDVSEPFPSRFQLSSSTLLLAEQSGWERRQTNTHNHLLHFRRTIFIILRVLTVFARTHTQIHTPAVESYSKPSCSCKLPALPKSIVGNFCYCLSLAMSRFLSLSFSLIICMVLFFVSAESLLRLQESVCWSRDEGWSVYRRVTGKIPAHKRVLMKGSGPGPTGFGVECWQGLWGASLWVLSPCWRVESTGRSISLQTECLCKEIKWIHLAENIEDRLKGY